MSDSETSKEPDVTMTAQLSSLPCPTQAPPLWTGRTGPAGTNAEFAAWLDEQERLLTHPAVVADRLRRSGWLPEQAHLEALRYRRRFDEHPLGYTSLLVATGVAALALGSLGHALAGGVDGAVNRNTVGMWLTVLLVSAPFAAWAHIWAARVDRTDPVAVWSEPRRSLATALLWGCGIIGMLRLVFYGRTLMGALVSATWAANTSVEEAAINVAVTVLIALPLGLWSYHFLHRFDDEDPSRPTRVRQRRAR